MKIIKKFICLMIIFTLIISNVQVSQKTYAESKTMLCKSKVVNSKSSETTPKVTNEKDTKKEKSEVSERYFDSTKTNAISDAIKEMLSNGIVKCLQEMNSGFELKNKSSGLMLNLYHGELSAKNGTKFDTYKRDHSKTQLFEVIASKKGVQFRNYCSKDKRLDVYTKGTGVPKEGNTLGLYKPTKDDCYYWKINYKGIDSTGIYITIESKKTPGLYIGLPDNDLDGKKREALILRTDGDEAVCQWYIFDPDAEGITEIKKDKPEDSDEEVEDLSGLSDVERIIEVAKGEIGYIEKLTPEHLYEKSSVNNNKDGKRDIDQRTGNWTKYAHEKDVLNGRTDQKEQTFPEWCSLFIWWCAYKAGLADNEVFPDYKAGVNSAAYFPKRKTFTKVSDPKPGDIVWYRSFVKNENGNYKLDKNGKKIVKSEYAHVGLIIEVDDKYIYTVEGNTSPAAGSKKADLYYDFKDEVKAGAAAVVQAKAYKKSKYNEQDIIAGYVRPNYTN